MRYSKLLTCVVSLLGVAACEDPSGVTEQGEPEAAALVRFINAGTDWGTVDLRFVDRVENLPTLLGVAFRAHSGTYQRVQPGARPARVFPYSTNADTTKIFLVDQSVDLAANNRYTLVYAGRGSATAPAAERHGLAVLPDPAELPTPPAGQIAIKALHAAVGTGNVDVYVVPVASATAATPADFATNNAAVLRNVAYLGQSGYVNVPVRPAMGTPLYRLVVTAAGSTTPIFAATPNLPGAPAPSAGQVGFGTVGPQPGVQISGSVLTAVVAPGSTPGSRQSTTATQTPTALLIVDKVLNP